jgi:hypothetical protein
MGLEHAQQLLKETLARSVKPQIVDVDVTNDFLHYHYRQNLAMFENRILFLSVAQVEIFQNDVVFVRNAIKQIMAQIVFANDEDAKIFADLLLSFRAHRSRNSGGAR